MRVIGRAIIGVALGSGCGAGFRNEPRRAADLRRPAGLRAPLDAYATPDHSITRLVKAQIYDERAEKVGPEKVLEPESGSFDANFTTVMALADGSVVVFRRRYDSPHFFSEYELSAEVFTGKWR
ncbi:hypothetical protein [Hansschlegelia zhihuaiae]|uniref:Uncharacterized protein n=1 Tax=Hansschlegelia zhihuaiae TaxID=405005 RepID=A0A4Q0MBV6_9HYPH|nr:hypothetical protein [Hansschlegelia zhihuaiae]RXF70808.1 hypothetical protein EK403_16650 [Hansschlegelia zhihuaiae]